MQLLNFLIMFYSLLDSKQSTIAVYLDFSKAFGTVNHDILMSKLLHNGISDVMQSLFKSHLSNKKQYVSIKNSSSSVSNITLDVPQGSLLGSVLFVLYINDMYGSSNQMSFVHFSDDTKQFLHSTVTLTMFTPL